jgi:hypothetical protein
MLHHWNVTLFLSHIFWRWVKFKVMAHNQKISTFWGAWIKMYCQCSKYLRCVSCIREIFLQLNTLSFLHSHSDQIMASASTLISILNLLSISCCQFLKILTTLIGGYKPDATWMTYHIDLAKRYWKKRCLIVSSWCQKTPSTSMPVSLCKIILGKDYSREIPTKNLDI